MDRADRSGLDITESLVSRAGRFGFQAAGKLFQFFPEPGFKFSCGFFRKGNRYNLIKPGCSRGNNLQQPIDKQRCLSGTCARFNPEVFFKIAYGFPACFPVNQRRQPVFFRFQVTDPPS